MYGLSEDLQLSILCLHIHKWFRTPHMNRVYTYLCCVPTTFIVMYGLDFVNKASRTRERRELFQGLSKAVVKYFRNTKQGLSILWMRLHMNEFCSNFLFRSSRYAKEILLLLLGYSTFFPCFIWCRLLQYHIQHT